MWNRISALIVKELNAIWGDEKSRMILIFPPLLQLFIFAFAATLEVKNISIGIINKDAGIESRELVHMFEDSPSFKKVIHLKSDSQIQQVIDSQEVIYILHIDSTFSKNIRKNKQAKIQFILDGRRSNVSQIVLGYSIKIIEKYSTNFSPGLIVSSKVIERNWFNPNLDYLWFTVPCLVGIITMLIGLLLTALSVAREREFGTYDQLLVSPLKPFEILMGKTIPAFILGTIEATIIILAAIFILGIPFNGKFIYLYGGILVFLASVIGVGLFISSISRTQQQAILGAFIIMMPAVLLSGYATPIENMPDWFQTLTYANPLRYFMVISKGVFLKDIPLEVVWENTWPMALIAFFTLTLSGWFFNRRLE